MLNSLEVKSDRSVNTLSHIQNYIAVNTCVNIF